MPRSPIDPSEKTLRGRSILLGLIAAMMLGCSAEQNRSLNKPESTGPFANATPPITPSKVVPRELRVPTNVKFENWQSAPVFRFNNGGEHPQRSILETLGGGVAVLDFDRDGCPDLCFAGGGRFLQHGTELSVGGVPVAMYRNHDEPIRSWRAISHEAFITDEHELFSLGVAAADFNNDGFTDLCVTGFGPLRLFENQGDGTFFECALQRQLQDRDFTTSAAWCDLNSDGSLDLYVCHYVAWNLDAEIACQRQKANPSEICGPKHFQSASDRFFVNCGDGTFRDGTAEIGLQPGGKGLGVVAGDVDRDGDVDICVANDTTANFLYLNDGHGRMEEVGALHGVAYDENGRPTGSMGVALADYDNDTLPDLWTTNFQNEALGLFRNMKQAQFHLVSRPAGVSMMHGEYVSWGTAFTDFDCDGDLDVVVANGHITDYVPQERLAQLPFLIINDGRGRFAWAQAPVGNYFSTRHLGRGLAVADFDGDGRPDIVVSHLSEAAVLLHNETLEAGSTLEVTLIGRDGNRDGIGTTALLETSSGSLLRQLTGGGSYLSTSEQVLRWGFPAESVPQKLTLHWPSGKTQVIDTFPKTTGTGTGRVTRMRVIEP